MGTYRDWLRALLERLELTMDDETVGRVERAVNAGDDVCVAVSVERDGRVLVLVKAAEDPFWPSVCLGPIGTLNGRRYAVMGLLAYLATWTG